MRSTGLLFAALTLSACVAGGPLGAPNPDGRTGTAIPEPKRLGASIEMAASDGSALAASVWGPEEPRAVILALHGYGDHGQSTFSAAGRHWAETGIRTYTPDQRGFGRNSTRAQWPGADALIADAVAMTRNLRAAYPCTPIAVLGHSMGGGVVLAGAGRGLDADGVVLAAPAIWGGKALNPLHRALAWLAAFVVPEKRFTGEGVVRIQASDNIEALRALGRDPLYLSPPSAREILGLVRITDRAAAAASDARLPALLLLGEKDQIVPNATVREVFARLPGKTGIIAYEDGWHLLFRDLQAETVWRDVGEWVTGLPIPAHCLAPAKGS